MTVTREDLNPCTVKLSIALDADEVREGFEKAFKQLAKKIKLPGFRPGMAPRTMVAPMISPDDLRETAADLLVKSTFQKAVDGEGLVTDATTASSVGITKVDQAEGVLTYEAKVPLPPKVTLGDYEGLPVEKPSAGVSDEEVEFEINRFRQSRSSREVVRDRGLQSGDMAVLNIKADGEEGEGRNMLTMAGQAFPQLDEAIEGMGVEDMKHLELTFPETYPQAPEWAGKTLPVQITLTSLSNVKLPEVDDSFAKALAAEDVEDLKKKVRELLGVSKAKMAYDVATARLLDTLLEKSEVLVSDNMWEALADRRIRETLQEQAEKGVGFEDFVKSQGMTPESYVAAWHDRARLEVQRALLIQQIFTKEQMTLTNEDLTRELYEMAFEYGTEAEEMFETLKKNEALDELQFRSISRKVGDLLLSKASVSAPAED